MEAGNQVDDSDKSAAAAKEGAGDKADSGKEASNPKEDVNPEKDVPVRLESEPLEEPGSPKGAAALEDQKPTSAAKVSKHNAVQATWLGYS